MHAQGKAVQLFPLKQACLAPPAARFATTRSKPARERSQHEGKGSRRTDSALRPLSKCLDPVVPEAQLDPTVFPIFQANLGWISSPASERLLTQSLICIISWGDIS